MLKLLRFRWVACQIEALEDCLDLPSLQWALSKLPKDLDDTYTRILEGIPRQRIKQATTILNLLIWSDEPLTIDELVDAIAVDLNHEPGFDPKNRMPVPREVLKLCSSLVAVSRDEEKTVGSVRLSHFSVKEYLTSDNVSSIYKSSFNETVAKAYLARVCLTYLIGISHMLTRWVPNQESINRSFPFADYSGKRWMDHARVAGSKDESLWRLMMILFVERPKAFYVFAAVEVFGYNPRAWMFANPLTSASSGGLILVVKDLLERRTRLTQVNAPASSFNLGRPLEEASKGGYDEIVSLLLNRGADVNAGDGAALQKASAHGHIGTVQLLLERGADVNARNDAALSSASYYGRDKVVQLLLDRGADANARYCNALHWASTHGHVTVVQLLLGAGVDVNAHDGGALSGASTHGHVAVVQLLLDAGANVNAQDGGALRGASTYGHDATVQLLLDRGADVNARDGVALQRASGHNYATIVQLLLNKGANAGRGAALYSASRRGGLTIVRLLLDKGADINSRGEDGLTSLTMALMKGHYTVAQLLLDRGASLDPEDFLYHFNTNVEKLEICMPILLPHVTTGIASKPIEDGANLLHYAASWGVKAVVQKCLDLGVNVHVQDHQGMTALHYAAENGILAIVKSLVCAGSDVNALDKDGRTPLAWAQDDSPSKPRESEKRRPCLDVVQYLSERTQGAPITSRQICERARSPDDDPELKSRPQPRGTMDRRSEDNVKAVGIDVDITTGLEIEVMERS